MAQIEIIPRPFYMERILPYIGKDVVKVLTGQRRVGKSFILRAVEKQIREREPEANFIRLNLEDFALAHITSASILHEEIARHIQEGKRNYIFIDEIQEVEGFERVLRSLILNPLNDIYVTGSNSSMLSSEIGSRLAGRSVDIRVHPLSYTEFLRFHNMEDSEESVDLYLRYGGMPYLRNLNMQNTWHEYLSGVADAIVFRDIVTRHSVRNIDFLNRMLLFMADNIGQLFTAKSIADYLKSQRLGGGVSSVQTYADYICEAFLVNRCRRWDIEGKRLFEIGEKYYFEDLGIRNSIIGYRPMDIGGLLENAVYNKLCSDEYKVSAGVIAKGREIDFVAEKNGERVYIQVAVRVDNEDTAKREFGNLAGITDNYRKILVTLRDSAPNTLNGIRMLSLRHFLTSDPLSDF